MDQEVIFVIIALPCLLRHVTAGLNPGLHAVNHLAPTGHSVGTVVALQTCVCAACVACVTPPYQSGRMQHGYASRIQDIRLSCPVSPCATNHHPYTTSVDFDAIAGYILSLISALSQVVLTPPSSLLFTPRLK